MPVSTEVESGFRPLKTREDYRLALHAVVLAIAPVFILGGFVTDTAWSFWTGLILGVADALLSFVKSPDAVRKVIYAVSGLVTAVVIVVSKLDPTYVATFVGAISTALGSLVAVFYTPASVTSNPVL